MLQGVQSSIREDVPNSATIPSGPGCPKKISITAPKLEAAIPRCDYLTSIHNAGSIASTASAQPSSYLDLISLVVPDKIEYRLEDSVRNDSAYRRKCLGLVYSLSETRALYAAFRSRPSERRKYALLFGIGVVLVGLFFLNSVATYYQNESIPLHTRSVAWLGQGLPPLLLVFVSVGFCLNRKHNPAIHHFLVLSGGVVLCALGFWESYFVRRVFEGSIASGIETYAPNAHSLLFVIVVRPPMTFAFAILAVFVPVGVFVIAARIADPVGVLGVLPSDVSFVSVLIDELLIQSIACLALYVIENQEKAAFEGIDSLKKRNKSLKEDIETLRSLLTDLLPIHFSSLADDFVNGSFSDSSLIAKADRLEDSIVVWMDVADFTTWCRTVDVGVVMSFLNHICSRIELFCTNHASGLARYKNVGDAFCCVANCEVSDASIAEQCVTLGFEIIKACRRKRVSVRVGIARGVSYLICVGSTNSYVRFDIFGDARKRAEVLESTTAHGTVSVDEALYDSLREKFVFDCNRHSHWEIAPSIAPVLEPVRNKSPATEDPEDVPKIDFHSEIESPKSRCTRLRDVVLDQFRKDSSEGLLLHPLLPLMSKPQTEMESLRYAVEIGGLIGFFWPMFQAAFCLRQLLSFFTFRASFAFTSPSPLMISTAVMALVCFGSIIAFFFLRRNPTILGIVDLSTALCFRLLFLLQICCFLIDDLSGIMSISPLEDSILVPGLMLMCSIPWPTKLWLSVIDVSFTVVYVALVAFYAEDRVAESFELAAFFVVAIFPVYIQELTMKRSYAREILCKSRAAELRSTHNSCAMLAHSILPEAFCVTLVERDFNGFSIEFHETLVTFIKFSVIEGFESLEEDPFWVKRLSAVFAEFDRQMKMGLGVAVKTIGFGYLAVLSPRATSEDWSHFILSLHKCRDVIRDDDVGEIFENPQIGLSVGTVGGGVIGSAKHRFDIWGEAVNRSARLCHLDTAKGGVLMTQEDADKMISSLSDLSDLGFRKGGLQRLKGIGDVECCFVSVVEG